MYDYFSHVFYRCLFVCLATHVTMCICYAELKGYLLTYLLFNVASEKNCLMILSRPPPGRGPCSG